MDPKELETVKGITCTIVDSVCDHFVDHHTVSEREQELLRSFAKNCKETIKTIEVDPEAQK